MVRYNLRSLQGVLNIPVTDDQALRMAFSSSKRKGFASSGRGESDLRNIRLRYLWKPSERLSVRRGRHVEGIAGFPQIPQPDVSQV
jgi:hypothetical protein